MKAAHLGTLPAPVRLVSSLLGGASVFVSRTEHGPEFMVIDAVKRQVSRGGLAQRGLRGDEVVGTPMAQQAFDIVEAIWLQDQRIAGIRGNAK